MISSVSTAIKRHDFAPNEHDRGPFIPTERSNNPKAGQWTNRMSHNMVADYKRFLMTDGEGIRCSLYVSGCPFYCEGCYNSSMSTFLSMVVISRICMTRCCSSVEAPTNASLTCRNHWNPAKSSFGRNCTTNSASFRKSTARTVPRGRGTLPDGCPLDHLENYTG